ncbi:MAG: DegV family protein [Anaerolineae bacterium]|nr:DegV family protein [Anaerolineae bacterium]
MSQATPHIVTDSTSDLPPELARRLDITVIPCQIHFRNETYREGVDITRLELYQRLRAGDLARTSQPAVGVFAESYRELLQDGRPIVSIHLASRLSGVYSTAWSAAQEVDPERICVVDTQQVSMCSGWVAVHAAEAAQEGASSADILRLVRSMLPRLRLYAVIDDLRFLQRSGRVSWAGSLLGNLLTIKPIVVLEEGRVDLAEKARSLTRGLDRVLSLATSPGPLEHVAVLHAGAPQAAGYLEERMARMVPREQMVVCEAGGIITAHAGPGAAGLACLYARGA